MASTRAKHNKNGELTGYEIRVSRGYDVNGKQLPQFTCTWKLPADWYNWGQKKQKKVLAEAVAEFELNCRCGIIMTKAEKREQAVEAEQARLAAKKAEANKPTLTQAIDMYIDSVRLCQKTNTIESKKYILSRFTKEVADKKLERVVQGDCSAYINDLIDVGGLCPSTARKHYMVLAAFFRWAVKQKFISESPLNGIAKPSNVDSSGEGKVEVFTDDEMNVIMAYLPNEPLMWRLLISILIFTGCRRGEVAGLRWKDIDFRGKSMTISNNAQYSPERGIYDTGTKSGKTRKIQLDDDLLSLLAEWQSYQDIILRGQLLPNTEYIFVKENGKRMYPQAPTDHLQILGKKCHIEKCHPHMFRHTFATKLIQGGIDVKTVSEILGHANIEITLKLYVHTNADAQKNAIEKYKSILLGKIKGEAN